MIGLLLRSFAALSVPAIARRLWWTALTTLALFAGVVAGVAALLHRFAHVNIPWLGSILDVLGGGLAAFALGYLLLPAVVATVACLFAEGIITAAEKRWYPGLPPIRHQDWKELIVTGLRLMGVSLVLGLIALPFCLIPVVNVVVQVGLNALIQARTYYELVAFRRLSPTDAALLRGQYKLQSFIAGALITLISDVPGLNLVAPVVAIVFMVHFFYRVTRQRLSPTAPA